MKKYISIVALLAAGTAFANAGEYTWTGNAGDGKWNTPTNWQLGGNYNDQYYPQTHNDNAFIGEDSGTIYWTQEMAYFSDTNEITVESGSILQVSTLQADINFNVLNLYGGTFTGLATAAMGFGRDFTIDFGDVTESARGFCDFSQMGGTLWTNDKTVTVKAEVQLEKGSSGEITLVKYGNLANSAYFNYDGISLFCETRELDESEYQIVADTSGLKVIYNVAIPEPSAFGLLAGLGALALVGTRRRRR